MQSSHVQSAKTRMVSVDYSNMLHLCHSVPHKKQNTAKPASEPRTVAVQNIAKPSKCTNLLVEYCFGLKRNLVSLSIPTDYKYCFNQMLTHTIARKFNLCRPCKSSSFASNTDTSAFIRRSSSFAGRAPCGTCCSDKAVRTRSAVLRVVSRWDSA